jgi:hypothetical protein
MESEARRLLASANAEDVAHKRQSRALGDVLMDQAAGVQAPQLEDHTLGNAHPGPRADSLWELGCSGWVVD